MFKGLLTRAAAKASCVNIKFDVKQMIQGIGVGNNTSASKGLFSLIENTVLALENNASQDQITLAMAEAIGSPPRHEEEIKTILAMVVSITTNTRTNNIPRVNEYEAHMNRTWKKIMGDYPESSKATLSMTMKATVLATEGRDALKNLESGKMPDGSAPGLRGDERYAPKPVPVSPPPLPREPITPTTTTVPSKSTSPNVTVSLGPMRELIETHATTGFMMLEHHEKVFSYAPDTKRAAVELYAHHIWTGWRAMLEAISKEVSPRLWPDLRDQFSIELSTALALKGNLVLHGKVFPQYGVKFEELYNENIDTISFLRKAIENYEDSIARHEQMPPVYSAAVRLQAEIFTGNVAFLISNAKLGNEMVEETCAITNTIHDLVLKAASQFSDKAYTPKRV